MPLHQTAQYEYKSRKDNNDQKRHFQRRLEFRLRYIKMLEARRNDRLNLVDDIAQLDRLGGVSAERNIKDAQAQLYRAAPIPIASILGRTSFFKIARLCESPRSAFDSFATANATVSTPMTLREI